MQGLTSEELKTIGGIIIISCIIIYVLNRKTNTNEISGGGVVGTVAGAYVGSELATCKECPPCPQLNCTCSLECHLNACGCDDFDLTPEQCTSCSSKFWTVVAIVCGAIQFILILSIVGYFIYKAFHKKV